MMKKYKNKKGFTLIELIVVIGIVAALSVTMGISFINTLEETQIKEYKETYDNIFDAAKLYAKLKVLPDNCEETAEESTKCGPILSSEDPEKEKLIAEADVTNVLPDEKGLPMCCLVESGLLDDGIFKTIDPTTDDKLTFDSKKAVWFIMNSEGEYVIAMNNNACGPEEYVFSKEFKSHVGLKDYKYWQGDCD